MSNVLRNMKRHSKEAATIIKIGAAKVLICIPGDLFENMNIYTAMFCCKAAGRQIADLWSIPGRGPEDSRNPIFNNFVDNPEFKDYTHIFPLDADTTPYNDFIIEKFLSLKKPVVSGVTPVYMKNEKEYAWPILTWADPLIAQLDKLWKRKREINLKSANLLSEEERNELFILDEQIGNLEPAAKPIPSGQLPASLFKAYRVGGTTMLIERQVLQKVKRPYQFTVRNINGKRVLSEDYWFSDRIREAGFEIWVDPTEWCRHANMNAIDEIGLADNTGLIEDAKRTGNTRFWKAAG